MADNHATPAGHPDMDYAEHERTYAMFINLSKWVVIGVVGILVLLAWLTL